jgi:hemerythrin-like domain-containing protein
MEPMLRDPALIPLSRQHHNGLAFCVATRRALGADPSAANAVKIAARAVGRYAAELANHFEIEEEVLFPACGELPVVLQLIAEHRAIEELMAQIQIGPTAELLERCASLLESHIRREETELFEQVQKTLPPEALAGLGREIARRAAAVRV